MTGSRGAVKALGWCMTKITAVASSPVAPKASSPVGSAGDFACEANLANAARATNRRQEAGDER